nr:MAG TPA: hypothetical protein [Caudoviricetes sp.]
MDSISEITPSGVILLHKISQKCCFYVSYLL